MHDTTCAAGSACNEGASRLVRMSIAFLFVSLYHLLRFPNLPSRLSSVVMLSFTQWIINSVVRAPLLKTAGPRSPAAHPVGFTLPVVAPSCTWSIHSCFKSHGWYLSFRYKLEIGREPLGGQVANRLPTKRWGPRLCLRIHKRSRNAKNRCVKTGLNK